MSLAQGTKLGPYEILAPIGAGGMGEVYRARDTRLGRDVAIKVLPEAFAENKERLARFEREARLLASLNHPNIAAIHELEESDGVHFLALEYVPGETLAERIKRGPILIDEALPLFKQIAEGLEAAHDKGVIHRDLKPANIKVTPDGKVKVLDFGLAKAMLGDAPAADASQSPTITKDTALGAILGTAAYMSPEQARGKTVDQRTDIWAFGCVAFEMLTGRQVFGGETLSDNVAAILERDPNWAALPADTPPEIRRLLHRCLLKDPKRRLHHIADALLEMEEQPVLPPPVTTTRPTRRIAPLLTVVAAALALLITGYLVITPRPTWKPPVYQRLTFRRGSVSEARFTPDGHSVVYTASWSGEPRRTFLRRLDSAESIPLDLGPARLLAVSSRSDMALLVPSPDRPPEDALRAGTLATASITGGGIRKLADGVENADWTPDGSELAVLRRTGDGLQLELPLGNPLYRTNGAIYHFRVSPNGDRVAFTDNPFFDDNRGSVAIIDMRGRVTPLSEGWAGISGLSWSPSGREVWFTASDGTHEEALYGVTLGGRLREIDRDTASLRLHDVRQDGRTLVVAEDLRIEIYVRPPGESAERNLSWRTQSFLYDISRDGSLISFTTLGQSLKYDACVRTTEGDPPVRLAEGSPMAISPDGRWVLGHVPEPGLPLELWPVGAGEPRRLSTGFTVNMARWLPDGRSIVVAGFREGEGQRLYLIDTENGSTRPISSEGIRAGPVERFCTSHDGRRVAAIHSDDRIWIHDMEGSPPEIALGATAGDVPIQWSADNGALFTYRPFEIRGRIFWIDLQTGDRKLWATLIPNDPVGVRSITSVSMTPDGSAYGYSCFRDLSTLFLVEGIQ
jgi:serine/threonine protein kinase